MADSIVYTLSSNYRPCVQVLEFVFIIIIIVWNREVVRFRWFIFKNPLQGAHFHLFFSLFIILNIELVVHVLCNW